MAAPSLARDDETRAGFGWMAYRLEMLTGIIPEWIAGHLVVGSKPPRANGTACPCAEYHVREGKNAPHCRSLGRKAPDLPTVMSTPREDAVRIYLCPACGQPCLVEVIATAVAKGFPAGCSHEDLRIFLR